MEAMFQKLALVKNGFKPIEKVAQKIVESHSLSKARQVALHFCGNDIYQVRCCAIFILGYIASKNNQVLEVMKDQAKLDPSWQVQEIIAKAFDQYCRDTGYEQALPTIKGWLNDENPNVCRAVTEGLRIWTSRPFFKAQPETAIQLISRHKASESEYLRKSVGNSLRDISKKHRNLVDQETSTWDLKDKRIAFTYKYVLKRQ